MKYLVSKPMVACLVALAGYSSVDASPTFAPSCFDTEEAAKAHQIYYAPREVDNSEASDKDHRAMKFAWQDDVLLSDLKSILGESQTTIDEQTKVVTHQWEIYFTGTPAAEEIRYDASNGYCLSTRVAGFGMVTYTWTAEVFDKTRGSLTRYQFYG